MKYTSIIFFIILISCNKMSFGQESLRVYAEQRQKNIGVAVNDIFFMPESNPKYDKKYSKTLKQEFNMIVAENAMKPDALQPVQNQFNFKKADSLVNFAERNNMKIRGHCLVWHKQIPKWMQDTALSKEQMLQILKNHITTVVSRYKGRISEWDVVNEAIEETPPFNLRASIWQTKIGPNYLDSAFVFAHRADPEALLFYNDYDAEDMGKKSSAVFNLVRDLKERGVPINGVGLQCHFKVDSFNISEMDENMKSISSLGLLANITELDISIPRNQLKSDSLQKEQAQNFGNLMKLCLRNKNCTSFIIWGLTDKYSWIPGYSKNTRGSALIFKDDYTKKYAYNTLIDVLHNYKP
jgi:endo-1,4-beta-xylanase